MVALKNIDSSLRIADPEQMPLMIEELQKIKEQLYTGQLTIGIKHEQSWSFYFRLGRLTWCQGGINEGERWQRCLKTYCPQLIQSDVTIETPLGKYDFLAAVCQQKLLAKETLIELITNLAQEIIFDLVQLSHQRELVFRQRPNQIPNVLLGLIPLDPILSSVQKNWQTWQKAGLASYSPNLYPVIKEKQQIVMKGIEESYFKGINGQTTLRGIAKENNHELLKLTATIVPWVKSGAIALSSDPLTTANDRQSHKPSANFLIAGIDDSEAICKQLESSLTAVGYEVITFQNSITAMSQLLKNPPDLILLDVMMPVINGYELCTQMRRAPKLKTIPVIILTGKDGWVDRAKAKMCGATDFLSKPVQKETLLETIKKYLPVNKIT